MSTFLRFPAQFLLLKLETEKPILKNTVKKINLPGKQTLHSKQDLKSENKNM